MSKASAYFIINEKSGKQGMKKIKGDLDKLSGIISVSMNTVKDSVSVDFETTEIRKYQLFNELERMGYDISETKYETHITM